MRANSTTVTPMGYLELAHFMWAKRGGKAPDPYLLGESLYKYNSLYFTT